MAKIFLLVSSTQQADPLEADFHEFKPCNLFVVFGRPLSAGRVGAITRSTSTAMDFPENLFNQAPHPKLVSSKSGNPGQATHAKKGAKNSAWKRRRVPRAKGMSGWLMLMSVVG